MMQGRQLLEQSSGQRRHVLVDGIDADGRQMSNSNLDSGDVEKVHGSVLEGLGPLEQNVKVRADGHAPHGPARKPGAAELRQRLSPRVEAPNSRGVSEHLVEG